jgi:hypothetical protein
LGGSGTALDTRCGGGGGRGATFEAIIANQLLATSSKSSSNYFTVFLVFSITRKTKPAMRASGGGVIAFT